MSADVRAPRRGQAGFALVLVLMFLAPLGLVAMAMSSNGRSQVQAAIALREAAQAEALADAGVYATIANLLSAGSGKGFVTQSAPREVKLPFELPGARLMVRVTDLSTRIDVNLATEALLRCVFQQAGLSDDSAAANVVRLRGASGERKGAPPKVIAIDELRNLPDVTAESYRRLEAALTVFGGRATRMKGAPPIVVAAKQCERQAQGRRTGSEGDDDAPAGVVRIQSTGLFGDAQFTRDATVELTKGAIRIRAWGRRDPGVSS